MPVTSQNIERSFESYLEREVVPAAEDDAVEKLAEIGKYGFEIAFEHGEYADQTGYLRSSIGWGVSKYGVLVRTGGFRKVKDGGGEDAGRRLLEQLAADFPDEICLFVVAGAKYAMYVEAKGFDVITFSKLQCERLANELFKMALS